jgi:hypothetical protein
VPKSLRQRLPEPVKRLARKARRGYKRTVASPPPAGIPQPPRPVVPDTPVRLLAGPANFAGQAWAWSRAAEREIDGLGAVVFDLDRGGLSFDSDYKVPVPVYRSGQWGAEQELWIGESFTHVLIDAMRPVLGPRYGEDCGAEIAVIERRGVAVSLAAHGSDIRLPSKHVELYPTSPFADPPAEQADYVQRLEKQAERLGAIIRGHDGPTFVSTPDLLDFAPAAHLLPVVVDIDRWTSPLPVLERERPVVLHAPSNGFLKGSPLIDPLLEELDARGVIEYRRIQGVPHSEMPGFVADSDIVVDQVVLGLYSVAAVEGLAAGRVVIAHVPDRIRARVPGGELPIVDATADTLVEVIEQILADRDAYRAIAAEGPAFARRVHDGRYSARVLADGLGLTPPPLDPSIPALPPAPGERP